MDKRQLINEVRKYNQTAKPKFLEQFDEDALRQYLDHLEEAWTKRTKIRLRPAPPTPVSEWFPEPPAEPAEPEKRVVRAEPGLHQPGSFVSRSRSVRPDRNLPGFVRRLQHGINPQSCSDLMKFDESGRCGLWIVGSRILTSDSDADRSCG